jgi:hypothetical protein
MNPLYLQLTPTVLSDARFFYCINASNPWVNYLTRSSEYVRLFWCWRNGTKISDAESVTWYLEEGAHAVIPDKIKWVGFVYRARLCDKQEISAYTNNIFFAKKGMDQKGRNVVLFAIIWTRSGPNIIGATRSEGPQRAGGYFAENKGPGGWDWTFTCIRSLGLYKNASSSLPHAVACHRHSVLGCARILLCCCVIPSHEGLLK